MLQQSARHPESRVIAPIVEGYAPATAPSNSGGTPLRSTMLAAERSLIAMILLEDDQPSQLVPDRNREGFRAFHRMLAPVPQSDSGTSVQSLGAVPVSKSLPPTGSGKP